MANLATTAEEILRSARSLIIAGGYNGFSYADISNVVGIRKASIHHHFPSKVDLVRTLLVQYRAEAEAGFAQLERDQPDPADQLRAYAGYWAECLGDPSKAFCVCALLATEIPVLPPEIVTEVRAHFRTLSAWLTSVLEKGAAEGSLAFPATARAEAEGFMAAVHGAMLSARVQGNATVFKAIVEPLIERLVTRHP